MAEAVALAGASPPDPRPGETILVAVNEGGSTLWAVVDDPPAGWRTAPFGPKARLAWRSALSALPRSLPVLWSSVSDTSAMPEEACLLGSRPAPNRGTEAELLDGASLGLSFLLILASRVLGRPLPAGLAASAAV
ncbi:MAG: hypothetical protein ACREQY_23630, partial [Candidatus Binatia bacterium]